ncbi:hypothetical protein A1D23_04615 [Chelonobacter oris]|uniref:HipA family kinase n=1 Tax=Chelonobacter oris TaxID=505317 RepID=UPI00244CDBE4|nr:HipA family kinase [Chelonobacter oris]MDH2999385.1 hypothetical protein [Chelonobacter oris]
MSDYLCEASDGKTYVVKTKSALTSKAIIAEYTAACLARKLGLPIPHFDIVYIPNIICQSVKPTWRDHLKEGYAFAIEYIEDATPAKFRQAHGFCDILMQKEIYLFDFMIKNSDRNLSNRDTGNVNLLFSESLRKIFLIDHNLAFDNELTDTDFETHVFSEKNREWVLDLVDRPLMQDKFSKAIRHIDNVFNAIPEEWRPLDDHDAYLDNIKSTVNRILTVEFWDKIQ